MNFKRLEVWKRSLKLCIDIYTESKNIKDYGFRNQLTQSSLSIPSNIAEGSERISKKDEIKFLSYARASCAELNTQILIGIEIKYIDPTKANTWLNETTELIAMLSRLILNKKDLVK